MTDSITPQEKEVLTLLYNRFYDLYEEITDDAFFEKEPNVRFYKIKEAFSVYKELLNYEPIKDYLKWVKQGGRPPLEGIISQDVFSFIRNVLIHVPVFDTWEDVYINENLAIWSKPGTIHRFLKKSCNIKIDGQGIVKYRIWEKSKKRMTYIKVCFPEEYTGNIYLKDIIEERDGIKFCMSLMRQILDTQVESDNEPEIVIMSQVYVAIRNKTT